MLYDFIECLNAIHSRKQMISFNAIYSRKQMISFSLNAYAMFYILSTGESRMLWHSEKHCIECLNAYPLQKTGD